MATSRSKHCSRIAAEVIDQFDEQERRDLLIASVKQMKYALRPRRFAKPLNCGGRRPYTEGGFAAAKRNPRPWSTGPGQWPGASHIRLLSRGHRQCADAPSLESIEASRDILSALQPISAEYSNGTSQFH